MILAMSWRKCATGGRWKAEAIINIAAPVTTTGDTTVGSAVVTAIPDTSAITAHAVPGHGFAVRAGAARAVGGQRHAGNVAGAGHSHHDGHNHRVRPGHLRGAGDFRHFVNGTAWDRTQRWQLLGPVSPQEDQWMRSGVTATGPRRRFRQVGRGT
jgi:hypothetical protein